MELTEIMKQINENGKTKEEKIKLLRKSRVQLLDEIHRMQQLLDRLDYALYEIKKE